MGVIRIMGQDKIRIIICDDMPFIAENFKNILNTYQDIEVVAIATNSSDCIQYTKEFYPDILLLDVQMNVYDEGIIILEKVKELCPDVRVIMCTIHDEDEYILRSFVLGASGYIVKTEPTEVIANTIREVYKNNVSLNATIAKRILKTTVAAQNDKEQILSLLDIIATLTCAEYEILKMIYNGESYKRIAEQRYVEEVTVRSQVNKILKKFNYKSMNQLINYLETLHVFD